MLGRMATKSPHVVIVGAGVTGLLLAQALKKEGLSFSVYEQESSSAHARPREWGMSIQWALPLLRAILPDDIHSRLKEATVDPSYEPPDPGYLPTLNAQNGELIKNMPLVKVYRVSRRKFRSLLAEGIDVHYGKVLKGIDSATHKAVSTAFFEDGSSTTGTLIVGADGARSTVRGVLFGSEQAATQSVPYTAVNTHVCYGDAEIAKFLRKWHPIYTMGIHPSGYWLWLSVQEVPDPEDAATWVFQLQCTWKRNEGEDVKSLSAMKERAKHFADPFKTAFQNIPDGTPVFENKMAYWIPQPWDSHDGKVLLIGDAAHPMTFQRGQGLNHCIADVAKVIDGLKALPETADRSSVIQAYQSEMIERAGDEVKLSLKNTYMLHDWDMLLQSPLMQRGAAQAPAK